MEFDMAMPHPQITMLPFGCVICQTMVSGVSLAIYRDEASIVARHVAFKRQINRVSVAKVVLGTEDDTSTATLPGKLSIVSIASRNVTHAYQAWRISDLGQPSEKFDSVDPTDPADPRIIMESSWLYFLLPLGVKPP